MEFLYIFFYSFLLSSRQCETQTSIAFEGIRHNTINVKNTNFDVTVSEMQNPADFYADFKFGARTFKVSF